jgi:hypothetical protein
MGGMGDAANAVDWAKVSSAEYRRAFDELTDNAELNTLMYKEALAMLERRNNSDFEDLSIISRTVGLVVGRSTNAKVVGQTRYTEAIQRQIAQATSKGEELIAIHNHPNSLPPSADDIFSMQMRGYSRSLIVSHDGSVFIIDKVDDAYRPYHYNEVLRRTARDGLSEYDAVILALNELRRMDLISWRRLL